MLTVVAVSLAAVLLCVGIHYELLMWYSSLLPQLRARQKRNVALGIVGIIAAHVLEIGVFASAMALLHQLPADWDVGDLKGADPGSVSDYLYCSALSYTTLGFEQITPVGPLRLLIGIEALVGLVLVAWSASFTYLQMDRHWSEHGRK